MSGVDLNRYQFDYDMTWAALFMNADLTIYGRYGSRKAKGPASADLLSLTSLKKAMERALEVHAGYPKNKDSLQDKRGPSVPWKRAEKIPSLQQKRHGNCIHCHHVPAGMRRSFIDQKKLLTDEQIWVHPLPDRIGLEIDVDDGRKVAKVVEDSPAARGGVRAGDEIVAMNGQPILSIADIQWVLHHAPSETKLEIGILRDGKPVKVPVSLTPGWKEGDISWRVSTWSLRPGLRLDELKPGERDRLGIAADELALRIRTVARNHPNKQRGFKRDDVFVEVGGRSNRMSEGQLVAFLRKNYKKGAKVKVWLWRDGRRIRKILSVG